MRITIPPSSQIQKERINVCRRLKFSFLLSVLVHGLGFLVLAPYLFKSCNKRLPKNTSNEVVFNIEFPRKENPSLAKMPPASLPRKEKDASFSKKKFAFASRTPREKFILNKPIKGHKTKEGKSKRLGKKKNQAPISSPQRTDGSKGQKARIPKAELPKSKFVKVIRGKRPFISEKIFEDQAAYEKIFNGSHEASIYSNGTSFLPGECGAGGCPRVSYLGRYADKYYWGDGIGTYFKSFSYPGLGKCFDAERISKSEVPFGKLIKD